MKSFENLASCAARVLLKYGTQNPDWTEWRELKDALLKTHPKIQDKTCAASVGHACSEFNQELSKVLEKGHHGRNQ